ncbi:hypothetical protein WME85_20720 [Sorangium sp. So ce1153]
MIGVIRHGLGDDRAQPLALGHEAERRGLHLHPERPSHRSPEAIEEPGVFLHRVARRDRADVNAERLDRGRLVRVDVAVAHHPGAPGVGQRVGAARLVEPDEAARVQVVLLELLHDLAPPRAPGLALRVVERRGAAPPLVRVERAQQPAPLRGLRDGAVALERRRAQGELAREERRVVPPRGLEVVGGDVVPEALAARAGDELSVIVDVHAIGHDHVAQGHLLPVAGADSAHGQRLWLQIIEELLDARRRRGRPHLSDPRGRDDQRLPALIRDPAHVVAEPGPVAPLLPAGARLHALTREPAARPLLVARRGPRRQQRLQLVLERRHDQHVGMHRARACHPTTITRFSCSRVGRLTCASRPGAERALDGVQQSA